MQQAVPSLSVMRFLTVGLLLLISCGGDTLYDIQEPAGPNRPPAASLAVTPLDGIAPLEVSIQLSCSDPDQHRVEHFLDADGALGYELSQWTAIAITRSYSESTTVRGFCRDEKNAESSPATEIVYVVDIGGQRATILTLTNAERAKVGSSALTLDNRLTAFAQAHAEDMVERGYFSHTTPDGKTFQDRIREAGISFTRAGENIVRARSAEDGMAWWVGSSGHYGNMTNPVFRKIGIGVFPKELGANALIYYVQVFTN